MAWNPGSYLRHATPRLRPALDLLSQTMQTMNTAPENIRRVCDLGCGPGNITSYLHKAFPNSHIHGVDSSDTMIAHAKKQHQMNSHTIHFTETSIQEFVSKSYAEEEKYDIIYSNAALHWIPNNEEIMQLLIKNVLSSKGSAGVLAIQMPGNHHLSLLIKCSENMVYS
jgi:trans-aconitate 2-methyltransferase